MASSKSLWGPNILQLFRSFCSTLCRTTNGKQGRTPSMKMDSFYGIGKIGSGMDLHRNPNSNNSETNCRSPGARSSLCCRGSSVRRSFFAETSKTHVCWFSCHSPSEVFFFSAHLVLTHAIFCLDCDFSLFVLISSLSLHQNFV